MPDRESKQDSFKNTTLAHDSTVSISVGGENERENVCVVGDEGGRG